jgi:hypothetical protein
MKGAELGAARRLQWVRRQIAPDPRPDRAFRRPEHGAVRPGGPEAAPKAAHHVAQQGLAARVLQNLELAGDWNGLRRVGSDDRGIGGHRSSTGDHTHRRKA